MKPLPGYRGGSVLAQRRRHRWNHRIVSYREEDPRLARPRAGSFAAAGSPGAIRMMTNIIIETPSRIGTSESNRRMMKPAMAMKSSK